MSVIEDYGLEEPTRKLTILALSVTDDGGGKEIDILHMNKILKYYEYLTDKKEIEFSNYNLGAVSFEIEESLSILEENGLVEQIKKDTYLLTDLGNKGASEILINFNDFDILKIKEAKIKLNDLSYNELLFFMYKMFPDTQENSTQIIKLENMKKSLILSLLKKEKIDVGTANKWLMNDDKVFQVHLTSNKIFSKIKLNNTELENTIKSNNHDLLTSYINNIFHQIGVSTYYDKESTKEVDISIWMDESQHLYGNPILLKIIVGKMSESKIHKYINHFKTYLIQTNSKTGILMYFDKEHKKYPPIIERRPNILCVEGREFLEKISKNPINKIIQQYI